LPPRRAGGGKSRFV